MGQRANSVTIYREHGRILDRRSGSSAVRLREECNRNCSEQWEKFAEDDGTVGRVKSGWWKVEAVAGRERKKVSCLQRAVESTSKCGPRRANKQASTAHKHAPVVCTRTVQSFALRHVLYGTVLHCTALYFNTRSAGFGGKDGGGEGSHPVYV